MSNATEPARCLGCRHPVRSAESLATGYGAGCRAKMRKAVRTADLSQWTAAQVADARQALEDGAVVPSTREGVYHVVSTDGSEVYRTHRDGCTCANGLQTRPPRPCWHRAAVAIVLAASATAPEPVAPRTAIALPSVPATVSDIDVWSVLESLGALDPVPVF